MEDNYEGNEEEYIFIWNLKCGLDIICWILESIIWAFIGGNGVFELPKTIIGEFGGRFNYLGASALSFSLNLFGSVIDNVFLLLGFKGELSHNKNIVRAILADGFKMFAAISTFLGVCVGFLGNEETIGKHWNEEDWPAVTGDTLYLTKAALIHFMLSANSFWAHFNGRDYGFINWEQQKFEALKNKWTRRALVFTVNFSLDFGMGMIFLVFAD